ncbi:protein-tyrosine-phosphatase [Gramella sp. AN32]|uniref:Protein-tyrosine-phosphatase n=1 Tax=Christiangramia antarctica TaxID=2058158 RepID=A0ABW5X7K3_9FLAO|nr:protein-tyrosine-phosphatase [Gramella sp. AN32]MCM4155514.1 protein-tyrosine-phosphatase [Gramella sp. AN32]
MYHKLENFISSLDTGAISEERKILLQPFIEFLISKFSNHGNINLNFICTHNSRRSHFGQIWAQTIARYFQYDHINCFSGGTENTEVFPQVIETFKEQGFKVLKLSEEHNPVYAIKYSDNERPIIGFSKEFDHFFNPRSGFAAIMTCSQADENCPYISGAEIRIALNYDDPKAFDNKPQKAEKYLERSIQIATELKFVFSEVKKALI